MAATPRKVPTLVSSDEDLASVLLGRMIRRLRESRGLTQKELARAAGSSQGNISKYETASSPIDSKQLTLVANALQASPQERRALRAQYRLTRSSSFSYGVIISGGVDEKQRSIAAYEKTSTAIDQYEPSIVPGLLQVPSYTRDVLRAFRVPDGDIEAATQERLRRQQILAVPNRKFHFILSEISLHTIPGSLEPHLEQLEALLLFHFARKNTKVGILPLERGTIPQAMTGFVIFDSMFATAETTVAEQRIDDPGDVRSLVALHARLSKKAVYDRDAMALVRNAIANLTNDRSE